MLRVLSGARPAALLCALALTACTSIAGDAAGDALAVEAPIAAPENPDSVPPAGDYRVDYDEGEMRCTGQSTIEELEYAPPDYVSLEVVDEGRMLTVQGWNGPETPALSLTLVDAGTYGTRYYGTQEISGVRNVYTLLYVLRAEGASELTGDLTSEGDCEVYRRFTMETVAGGE